jgi:hypothetical protein
MQHVRATNISAYLVKGGPLETAADIANRSSTRTTQLHDRRRDGAVSKHGFGFSSFEVLEKDGKWLVIPMTLEKSLGL